MSGSGSLGSLTADASIPLQAGKGVTPPPNPLAMIGEFANIQNALNTAKLNPLIQTQMSLANQRSQVGLQSDQSSLIQQQRQFGYAGMAPLLAKNGLITHDDLTDYMGGLEHSGVVTQPLVNEFAGIPYTDPAAFDARVRAMIGANSQAPANAVGAVSPRAGSIDTGPAIQPTLTPAPGQPGQGVPVPAGGVSYTKAPGPQMVGTGAGTVPTNGGQPTGPMIPNAPTPAEQNQLQQVWNPATKQFDYVPRTNVAPMVNGAGQPVNGGAPAVPGLPTTGRIQPPAAPAAPPPATGGAAASAPLGTNEEAVAAAVHAGAARERANNYQSTIFPIEGALTSLQGADTGTGGEVLNNIRGYLGDTPLKYLSNFLPSTLSDQDKRAIYDEANKYTTGMAIGGPGGARSNEGQAASSAANPSVHISNTAAVAVTKSILAQRRMDQAGTLAFNNTGLPANQYDQFMNTWNTNQDPRAYAIDKMTPSDRSQLVTSMGGTKSAAYQKFKASVQAAIDAKVIPNPSGTAQ